MLYDFNKEKDDSKLIESVLMTQFYTLGSL